MNYLGTAALGAVTVASALGLYVSSYMVAEQQDRIEEALDGISADEDAIGRLEAELGVRASLARLERINSEVWSLKAPRPNQIVGGSVHLASLLNADVPLEPQVHVAAAEVPVVIEDVQAKVVLASADTGMDAAIPPEPDPVPIRMAETPVQVAAVPAETSEADFLSDDFLKDVEVAAQLERAGFQKVALR